MSAAAMVVGTVHAQTAPDISVGHVLMQLVVGLAVVIGGIWGFSKFLGRGRRPGLPGMRRPSGEQLTVLSRQSLGKGLSIAAVRWGDREVLVGIAGTTITFLDGGDPPEARAEGVPVYGPPVEPPASVRAHDGPTAPPWVQRSSRPTFLQALRDATARH
jgi:flagellar biogenesis protein FliO